MENKIINKREENTSSESLRRRLYSLLFYNSLTKKMGMHLLNSSWFVNNSIYQKLQDRHIERVIRTYKKTPNIVVIENTNKCNYKCAMCPHDIMKREQGVMEEKLFIKIIDQCAEMKVKKIGLHGFGEPLLDKDFAARVKYAKSKGIPSVGTSSNASLMTPDRAKEIILSGIDEISFSLDAFYKKTYEKMRPVSNLDKIVKNIEKFISIRNKLGKKKPIVVVDMIETANNKGETKLFISKWEKLADRVNITTPHAWGGSYDGEAKKRSFHSKKSRSKVKREPCRFLWTDLLINWNGEVSACCQDYEAVMTVGNANKSSLKEIWQGDALNRLRRNHLTGKMDIGLCRDCDYRSVWWLFQ
ncbi:MAG: molybdopterin cofactor synthesis protein MoaA [uncultured bacterium]|nr:MAG: molybdopterin cofactor synthesis protein MoaA [uncultured bacterium]